MPEFNDRGRLVIHDEADGTMSLAICEDIVDGKPINVHARYFRVPRVEIARGIAVTRNGQDRYSNEIVEVDGRGQSISVRYPKHPS